MFYVKRNRGDNLWRDIFNFDSTSNAMLKTDIFEDETNYVVKVEIPGISKEDVKIEFADEYLTISATRKAISEEEGEKLVRHETVSGDYSRTFYVGSVNENEITAKSENGILTVIVPKKMEEKEVKKAININWL